MMFGKATHMRILVRHLRHLRRIAISSSLSMSNRGTTVGGAVMEIRTLTRPSRMFRSSRLLNGFVFPIMLAAALTTPSPGAAATTYELSDLAFPLEVGPGTNVSFVINESMPERYLYSAGNGGDQQLVFWWSRDGQAKQQYSSIAGIRHLDPGAWNLSFETSGRIAVAYSLPLLCGWPSSSLTSKEIICPSISVTETTAFTPYTWTSGTHVVRVQGDIDSYFFDRYLRPLGQTSEFTYEGDMDGIIVIAPRGTAASVVFTITLVPESSRDLNVFLVPIAVLMAIIVIVALIVRRRKRRTRSKESKE